MASFFLSRIDVLIDALLEKKLEEGSPDADLAGSLRGEVAVASAKIACQMWKEIFAGQRFQRLAARGANPQRVLWASTGTRNPAHSDVKYVEALFEGLQTKNVDGGLMNCFKQFRVAPGSRVRLKDFDPQYAGKHEKKISVLPKIENLQQRMDELQFKLYAEQKRSLLICLQALDAGGKDGVVRHVIGSMNPQGCRVVSFKQPSPEEAAHDYLWRIEHQAPKRGEVVIFNRSHYEDVLIVRVHDLVPKKVWSKRYEQINDFERRLVANGTHILKFFLHISKEEQLQRFKQRLDDPARHWKISEADYSEREYFASYEAAYEDALSRCSTSDAPWFVIPSDHKWFRNLAISQIIVSTMEKLGIELPEPTVNIADIRRKYHEAVDEEKKAESKKRE